MHPSLGTLRPAIVFIVFFLVYRDEGFCKPYLDQQEKQKTITGGASYRNDPMNQISKPT